MMNVQQAIEKFRTFSPQEKMDMLVHLAHALTILARDTYIVTGEGVAEPARLRRITEVQHRLLGALIALMKQETTRYPDEVLVRLVLEHSDDQGLQDQLLETFHHLTAQLAAVITSQRHRADGE
ncbi:MAG: hypothetical protein FJZ47_13850 [Candidatus Tectomicrobia bacterium]|uniref:Uncharacterized protein n=1 Tax=Tectimicrobiota bacterium TaxID=2528274 RepID=A0A937W131_UNCTE|nr:hypothetical protein [Candidatus Tectomicrobia bacterium]